MIAGPDIRLEYKFYEYKFNSLLLVNYFQTIRNERKFECDDITFEGMLDRLEQNSGVNVVSAKVT